MDSSTITTSTFLLSGGITGTVSYNSTSKIATFTPSSTLEKNTSYTVTLTTGITNSSGTPLAANYTWTFTTSNSDSNCFIATAVYGSSDDDHVVALRDFRDRQLLPNTLGAALVRLYYHYSPPVADYLKAHEVPRTAVRWMLNGFVYLIQQPFLLVGMILCGLIVIIEMTLSWANAPYRKPRRNRRRA
jgi:hypothetical protein